MLFRPFFVLITLLLLLTSCSDTPPPLPVGPIPSARQLNWHELEYYGFIHFNMNTFTDMEWGSGAESPERFAPTQLDTDQWARVAKEAGMKGLILTAKHHDGFCLWPTATTEHSVKNSPWKNGEGDVVKELAESCAAYGLKFGVYLSPWDRNNAHYGTPEYLGIFRAQLRELLTNYGELFEIWFDGANGGSGYYGGANETREIDNRTYYEWDKVTAMIRDLQPNAVIFSDAGPDIRWVGTEEGTAMETNWSIMRRAEMHPGWPRFKELRSGHIDGTHWLPAEADTSIRPGWYYHPGEDHQVKSLSRLVDIYYESVGRNSNLLLNLPVDTRGLVHENDIERLMALKEQIDKDFVTNLALSARVQASNTRGNAADFAPDRVADGDPETYWSTDDGVTQGVIELVFKNPVEVNRMVLQEYIPLGQRISSFRISALVANTWKELDLQTTVGYKRILRFPTVSARRFRVEVLDAKGPVTISNLELYKAPSLLVPPVMHRDKSGKVSLTVPEDNLEVYYTLDGSTPGKDAMLYEKPFDVPAPATLKALTADKETGARTEVITWYLDIAKSNWKVLNKELEGGPPPINAIDDNPNTFWKQPAEEAAQGIAIDLGRTYNLKGFTYWPIQSRFPFGMITRYVFEVSLDGEQWKEVARGEFANIVNNRIRQKVDFNAVEGRYVRLKALDTHGESETVTYGEIGVITR